MRLKIWIAVSMTLMSLMPAAFAQDAYAVVKTPMRADTATAFAATAARVRTDMQPGGRYEFIGRSDQDRVEALLDRMTGLFDRYGNVAAMQGDAQVELFNDQEQINGLLEHNDEQRLVCERRPKIGSHIPETTCRTLGDIERGRRDANKAIADANDLQRAPKKFAGDQRGGN